MRRTTFLSLGICGAALLAAVLPISAQTPDVLTAADPPAHAVWLETLGVTLATQGYGTTQAGHSIDNNPLTLNGIVYLHGLGTHAPGEFAVNLHGAATRFTAMVGVDDEKKSSAASVTFTVLVDGKPAAQTGIIHGGDKAQRLSVDLTGAQKLVLQVGDGGDGMDSDHADWAGAMLTLADAATARPEAVAPPSAPPAAAFAPGRLVILPPDPRPAIHGPRIVGTTPGRPFLFLIPATGDGPLTYTAKGLPAGLSLDAQTGIISGTLTQAGTTVVALSVRGPKGTAKRKLTLVGGDHKLALTPPMGWNSWNVWAGQVDEGKVRAAADEMMATGLAGHGFGYINVDDTWEAGHIYRGANIDPDGKPGRDAQGNIQTNRKFPDMKALGDYIHSKGLKFGIYSSPGPLTCGQYTASYQHEDQDAQSYASWGVDYLKYDWCSYGGIAGADHSLPALQRPYTVMRASLDKSSRDIVYSLCQYGDGSVWTWGADPAVGGNCWRTHGDINDSWRSLHDIYEKEVGHEKYAGPGHWNDPDMLEVGYVGFGNPHASHLTPNEQILHISLWCLVSSPLLIGCDMTRLDPFTVALLSNDEALDINQDPLGQPAGRVAQDGDLEVWARPLFDGTHAAGLVNGGPAPATVTVKWSDLGVSGRQPVRDLWMHKDIGTFADSYAVEVPAHGCVLLKIGKPKIHD